VKEEENEEVDGQMELHELSPLERGDSVKKPDSTISTGVKQVIFFIVVSLYNIMQFCHVLNL
jgi:hypothetical protein